MDPYENLFLSTLDKATNAALQLGGQYFGSYLARGNLEAQYDLAAKYRTLLVPPTPNYSGLLILGIAAAVIIAIVKD